MRSIRSAAAPSAATGEAIPSTPEVAVGGVCRLPAGLVVRGDRFADGKVVGDVRPSSVSAGCVAIDWSDRAIRGTWIGGPSHVLEVVR